MSHPWSHNRRFNSYTAWCTQKYGTRLQKLSIDAGFTCPNRDGTLGKNGCSFCLNDSFNPSYCSPDKSITHQIDEGILFHKTRYKRAAKYIAYFQAYSNTYAPLENLKSLYTEALNHPEIAGISIGTRPDCISEELLEYLSALSLKHFVSVEYGIESCYDKTLLRVNRGHSFDQAKETIELTSAKGIQTGAHLIFGLPGESREEMMAEAEIISSLPMHSIKFHQLQILKGTKIETEFVQNRSAFHVFSLIDYIEFIIDFLERTRSTLLIERLSGEVPPIFLAAPGWGLIRNDQVLQMIEKRMEERNTWQGKNYV